MKKSGLMVEIYRSTYRAGIINKMENCTSVIILDSRLPDLFAPTEQIPAVKLVTRNIYGKEYTHAEPIEPGSYAMGGSFIYTCDSRLRNIVPYPIPLHDRQMNLEKR